MNAAEACQMSKSHRHYKIMSVIKEYAELGNTEVTFRDSVGFDSDTADYYIYMSGLVDSCLCVRHILESEGYTVTESSEKTTIRKWVNSIVERKRWFGITKHEHTDIIYEPASLRVIKIEWCCNE